ncbi:MAG: hypothetical protein KAQ79_12275, partial [Cyclobacteriaceae bacterium]|nr:hypothetical protein [Cyclobacteriaceae bacterium]
CCHQQTKLGSKILLVKRPANPASPAGWRTGRHNMGDSIKIGDSILRGIFIINLANLHELIGVLSF